ncbi:Zn-ribbon domain-containing OB-fold protein, partial [Chloroflexus sp.]
MNIARHWRERTTRYRLEGQRHRHTGEVRFPPQPPTLDEDPNDWEPCQLSGRGEIYSFSVIRQAPSGFASLGIYPVALVRLEEGPLVTAQLTDCDEADLAIGMPVEMVTRRLMDTGEDGV